MYERSYGYRYEEPAKSATNADIAKMIRRDVKQAQEEGLLPPRWTYSVRSDHLAIDVDVRDCPDAWQPCDGTVPGSRREYPDGSSTATGCPDVWCAARNDPAYAHAAKHHDVLTEEARVAEMTLERIHNAYNHDGSEVMVDYFDVRYYGGVTFEDASSADFRAREKERMAAKRAARDAGIVVGRIANHGRDGRSVVHVLIETTEGKTVYACGARVSAYGFRQRVADDEPVTCSRCAKKHG